MILVWLLNIALANDTYQTLLNKQAYLQCKVEKLKTMGDLTLEKVKEMKSNCSNDAKITESLWEKDKDEKECEWKPCQKHALKSEHELCLNEWVKGSKNQNLQDCLLTTVHDACQDTFAALGSKKPRKIYWKHGQSTGYWFCSPKLEGK